MKKQLLLILAVLSAFTMYAQTTFEAGYFINNENERIECLIKNLDWKNNPTSFQYKISENAEVEIGEISKVKEFGIASILKYQRAKVNIDRSSENLKKLSIYKNPNFNEETLYLKILIEGKSTLYQYLDASLIRYFYSTEGSKIEQLIFKSYKGPYSRIAVNNTYKQELYNNLKCTAITSKTVEKLEYKETDLVNFFKTYNECTNSNFTNFKKAKKKDLINLTIRSGLKFSDLYLQYLIVNTTRERDLNFDSSTNFRFGLELELLLPFNNNKWSVFLEPTYQSFQTERQIDLGFLEVDYSSIEVLAGIRHYFFINEKSKIFIDGAIAVDANSGQFIELDGQDFLEINVTNAAAFGIGFKYNDKYSLQLSYQTVRKLVQEAEFYDSEYNTTSLIFGYTLF